MPVEVRTSQSTNSLSLRSNDFHNDESDLPDDKSREFVHPPKDEEDIFDNGKSPEEKAAAELRASKRSGNSLSLDNQQETVNSNQQLVYRKG